MLDIDLINNIWKVKQRGVTRKKTTSLISQYNT